MKKYKFLICALGVSISTFAQADGNQTLDELLLQWGVVDSNYKYTDISAASKVIRDINNRISESLPVKINSEVEIKAVFMTPYYSRYSYRYLLKLSDTDKMAVNAYLNSNDSVNDLCNSVYTQKNFIANNHKIDLTYYDIDNKLVSEVTLSSSRCNTSSSIKDTRPPSKQSSSNI